MGLLLRHTPETIGDVIRRYDELELRPRICVPKEIRVAFISPAAMAFATFALGGFYAALTPGILAHSLHQSSPVTAGTVVALFFGIGALAVAMTRKLSDRSAMLLSTLMLLAGLALLIAAERQHSMAALIAATVISGTAIALGYRFSLQIVNQIAPQAQRAEVVSAYLLVCYAANSLPVIGVGLLSRTLSPTVAHVMFAALLSLLAILACIVGWRYAVRR